MQSTIAIVGRGRLGPALAGALSAAGHPVLGPLGRGADGAGADIALLCVPDGEIAPAARAIAPRDGLLVGHCSGATGLDVLDGHEAFGLHPLMTVTRAGAPFAGAGCAVAGSTARALAAARSLAAALGMDPFEVADEDRAAYHAAASIAANILTTLVDGSERLAATAGVPRSALAPLVRQAVENWVEHGAAEALTGPIVRGDNAVVARQRMAVAARTPDLVVVFDTLVAATRDLARRGAGAPAGDAEARV
jgi:predicted short-subunit dehydrogenase-like oxidoreductase (DUF2520 family)